MAYAITKFTIARDTIRSVYKTGIIFVIIWLFLHSNIFFSSQLYWIQNEHICEWLKFQKLAFLLFLPLEICSLLIIKGVELDARSKKGFTALMVAAEHNSSGTRELGGALTLPLLTRSAKENGTFMYQTENSILRSIWYGIEPPNWNTNAAEPESFEDYFKKVHFWVRKRHYISGTSIPDLFENM